TAVHEFRYLVALLRRNAFPGDVDPDVGLALVVHFLDAFPQLPLHVLAGALAISFFPMRVVPAEQRTGGLFRDIVAGCDVDFHGLGTMQVDSLFLLPPGMRKNQRARNQEKGQERPGESLHTGILLAQALPQNTRSHPAPRWRGADAARRRWGGRTAQSGPPL